MEDIVKGIGMTSQRTRDRLIGLLEDLGIENKRVLEIIGNTPRHLFVDEALASRAYENTSLPIGYNQTISQPYIVARMTELLLAESQPQKVLEIGTGCGYQTAILAKLVDCVLTIERISALLIQAKNRFSQLGYCNIQSIHADGHRGWLSRAPFDAILVTAAPKEVPDALLSQLKLNGRLVLPVGDSTRQKLKVLVRRENHFEHQDFESVSFVPLLGGQV